MKITGWKRKIELGYDENGNPNGKIEVAHNFSMHWNTTTETLIKGTTWMMHKGYVWVADGQDFKGNKLYQVRIGQWDDKNKNYPSKDYTFKNKIKAQEFAIEYMKKHPRG